MVTVPNTRPRHAMCTLQTPLRAGAPLPIAPILKELTSSGFLVDQLGAGGHDWARSARECTFMNDHERRETFEQYRTVAEEQPHSYSLPVALDRRGLVNAAHGPMPNRSKRLASLVSLRGQPPKVARIEPAHERQTGAAKAIADELLRVRNSDVGCTRVVAYEDVEWLPQSEVCIVERCMCETKFCPCCRPLHSRYHTGSLLCFFDSMT